MKTIIIFSSNKRKAISQAKKDYGDKIEYVKPYRYASKGNNFYEFKLNEK